MKVIIYYISLPFIYLIALLPFWLIYKFSDTLFFVFYRLVGYRKQVVYSNLKRSFPEKSEAERKQLQLQFYSYFFDLALETVKSLRISPRELRKRISFEDTSIFQRYFEHGQSIIIVMGHYGNWELAGARFALEPLHKLYVVYHPLHNKYFDQLMYKMRTRFGNGLYSMKGTLRGMLANRKNVTATAFIADQTPAPDSAYWMDFLNQDTPVFKGTGKIANKFNYPVVYASIKRVRRGYYSIHLEELCATPSKVDPEEIVQRFTKKLEQDIREMPEIWLWTHRRWKHKRQSQKNSQLHA